MNKSESIANITKAVISVMTEVQGIDKTMTVGEGKNAYKGVPDQEVKKKINAAMGKNGLAIFPISIEPTLRIDRWEEETQQWGKKQKQAVFAEVQTRYLLTHTSGEWIELCGYGHGTDTQDKAAGKATTYSLKYTLLYTFLVPTGKIDDADNEHSENKAVAPVKKSLTEKAFADLIEKVKADPTVAEKAEKMFSFTTDQYTQIQQAKKSKTAA